MTLDVGGTLDGPGIAWRPRFERLYRDAGLFATVDGDAFRRAFFDADDHLAERHALAGLGLDETVRLQVADTLATLGRATPALIDEVAGKFVAECRASYTQARPLLERLARDFPLGIVSNFYGNLRSVLASVGILELFRPAAVIDSRELGVEKPDARIFHAACRGLETDPAAVAHVGDSWERDIVGARKAGLLPVFFGSEARPESGVVHIRALAELEPAMSQFAGILAAGQGSRFAKAGVATPKALVCVAGKSLLARAVDAFGDAGFPAVTVVTNDAVAPDVRAHLAGTPLEPRVELCVRTTASTLETFTVLLRAALERGAESFAFTTVDAITAPRELARFAEEARRDTAALTLGVAPVEPEDDGPLRVELDGTGRARLGRGPHATAGFYAGRTREIAPRAFDALASGVPSLRAFLTSESERSVVRGIVLARAVDVDTPADVIAAEKALGQLVNASESHR